MTTAPRHTRYRTNWRGKLILQIGTPYPERGGTELGDVRLPAYIDWRDATTSDITEIKETP